MLSLDSTREYALDEGSFALPLLLRDQSIQIFTLSGDGPSEFNLVITRADVDSTDNMEKIAGRLNNELN